MAKDILLAACGAHMSGLPLNPQLTERGAELVKACKTAPVYRLYALMDFDPPRPGMIRHQDGAAIDVEVWRMAEEHFGSFMNAIPAPLCIGTVELDDGESVKGFLCEPYAVEGAKDISHLGSWRAFINAQED